MSEALRGGRVPDLCEAQDGADCVRAFFAEQLELRWARDAVVSNLTFLDANYYADGFWDGPGQQPSDLPWLVRPCP